MIKARPTITQNQTAILFFSRASHAEGSNKPYLGYARKSDNQHLASCLIEQAKSVAYDSGLPVIHCTEKEQNGIGFGEKLANAFQQVYDIGYTSVIAIGNDTPGIADLNWERLNVLLQNQQAVIGPTQCGGAYVIGLHKEQFERTEFQKLAWQKETIYQDLKSWLGNRTSFVELDKKVELTTEKDFTTFLVKANQKLKKSLRFLRSLRVKSNVLSSTQEDQIKNLPTTEGITQLYSKTRKLQQFYLILKRVIFGEVVAFLAPFVLVDFNLNFSNCSRRGPPVCCFN